MTKEEILTKYIDRGKGYGRSVYDVSHYNCTDNVLEAMSEHAKQESIAFHNWWDGYKKEVEQMVSKMPYNEERKLAAVEYGKLVNLSTEEKYFLFQQYKSKQ